MKKTLIKPTSVTNNNVVLYENGGWFPGSCSCRTWEPGCILIGCK